MTKRFLSMIAILAISLLAACAQVPSHCKGCPTGFSEECCGACPCGEEATAGKICDHSKKKAKHHSKRHHKPAAAITAPAVKAVAKDVKAAPTIPNQEKAGMFDGVKKIIQDVQSKDVQPKDVKKPQ